MKKSFTRPCELPLGFLALLLVCLGAQPSRAQLPSLPYDTLSVLPATTDSNIIYYNEHHFVFTPRPSDPAELRNRLFIMLPGTGGRGMFYRAICEHAAGMGFHAISLTYNNDTSLKDACGTDPDTNCHENGRLEIQTGQDLHPLFNVDRTHSIEHRIIALLQYLNAQFPADGWGQYLGGPDSLRWEGIALGGHSQGGGHAGLLGKRYRTARVLMFGAMDISQAAGGPAPWISRPGATPDSLYFGFTHLRDPGFFDPADLPGSLQSRTWRAYGMDAHGPLVNVDTTSFPYGGTNTLLTDLPAHNPGLPGTTPNNFHGSPVVSVYVPRRPDGSYVYDSVWTYLLGGADELDPAPTSRPTAAAAPQLYPNPAHTQVNLSGAGRANLILYNLLGQPLRQWPGRELPTQLSLDGLPPGLYLLQVEQAEAQYTRRLQVGG